MCKNISGDLIFLIMMPFSSWIYQVTLVLRSQKHAKYFKLSGFIIHTIFWWPWLVAFPSSCWRKYVSLSLFSLGGTTYRVPNYSLPFSWSCQSCTCDNRCLPMSSDPLTGLPTQTLAKLELEKFRKHESSKIFVPSHLKCLGTFAPAIKHSKGTDIEMV